MRQGEKSLVMCKPKWGYNHETLGDKVKFPTKDGWDSEDRRDQLKNRRAFFEVTLLDWIVRHNLLGDDKCSIMKTIHERGTGYDRPSNHDEITFSYKVY
jgi:hypothetical protein